MGKEKGEEKKTGIGREEVGTQKQGRGGRGERGEGRLGTRWMRAEVLGECMSRC